MRSGERFNRPQVTRTPGTRNQPTFANHHGLSTKRKPWGTFLTPACLRFSKIKSQPTTYPPQEQYPPIAPQASTYNKMPYQEPCSALTVVEEEIMRLWSGAGSRTYD